MVNLLRIIFISLKVIKFHRTGETGRMDRSRFLNFALSSAAAARWDEIVFDVMNKFLHPVPTLIALPRPTHKTQLIDFSVGWRKAELRKAPRNCFGSWMSPKNYVMHRGSVCEVSHRISLFINNLWSITSRSCEFYFKQKPIQFKMFDDKKVCFNLTSKLSA